MQDIQQNTIKEKVLQAIQNGTTKMKPKWHFVLKATLFLLAFLFIFLTVLYLLSFTLFVVDKSQLWFVPQFGMHGLFIFFRSLPWLLIFIVIVFFCLLQILARHYSFSYQRPVVYSALGIVILVLLGGSVVQKLGIHEGVSEYSRSHKIPFAGQIYERFEFEENNSVYPGVIIEIRDPNFSIQTRRQEILEVRVDGHTRFPVGKKFVVGDEVLVLGEREENYIEAFGVRPIPHIRGGVRPPLLESDE